MKIGDSNVSIDFIQPEIDYSDNNDDSVVALVDYNDVEILLTGDISSNTEEDLINSGLIGDIEVLKVPHHGSKYSSSKEFLDTVGARNSIISVGKDNTYGHPTSEVLERLTASVSNIWRTDVNGNIVVSTDGNIIRISCDDKVEDNNKPAEDIKPGTWISENGKWYYYKNGVKQTGWVNDKGHWYYLSNTGEMKTGWYTVGSKWYYSNSSGVMQTGWLSDGGTWYYLNSSGEMSTGWYMVGSKWYYSSASGAMRTGWLNDNGTWYYLRSSGEMAKGWYMVGSKWYYSSASGAMRTGWLNDNGTWYYLRSSGEMATGWLNDNGTWYYLDSSGKMVTNAIIDNWQIDSNGVATPAINGGNNSGGSDNSSQDRTVYVTPSGKSYHYNDDCVTLKRSTTILSMSKSEAISKGKSDPCNLCVK